MKEQKNSVYWSNVEFTYDEKSKEFKNLKGGFVYVFVKAFDAKEALDLILKAFNKEKKDPFFIEFLMPYDEEIEWESKEETNFMFDLYKDAKNSTEVIFDTFYAYEELSE